ncbi:MAG TPA: hypothetical protein VJB61_20380 [Actinomycetota bacterium]
MHLGRALHETALGLATDIGERYEWGRALEGLARALDAADQPADAHQRRQEALTLYEDLGVPEAEALRRDLATAGTSRG